MFYLFLNAGLCYKLLLSGDLHHSLLFVCYLCVITVYFSVHYEHSSVSILSFENVCLNVDYTACTAITCDSGNEPMSCYIMIIDYFHYLFRNPSVSFLSAILL